MTEAEWVACDEPGELIAHLRRAAPISKRRLRLFAAACCRHVWRQLPEATDRAAVVAAERYADGEIPWAELTAARKAAYENCAVAHMEAWWACHPRAWVAAEMAAHTSERVGWTGSGLLRDVAGNPFRPVAVDPRWRTGTVVALARGVYGEQAFDRLPVLADALDEAGCGDEQVLGHCRDLGPHVRGCWVVDLLLGKG